MRWSVQYIYMYTKHNTHENGKYVTCGVCRIDLSDVLGGRGLSTREETRGFVSTTKCPNHFLLSYLFLILLLLVSLLCFYFYSFLLSSLVDALTSLLSLVSCVSPCIFSWRELDSYGTRSRSAYWERKSRERGRDER